jgi:hypothetical protein
MITATLLAILGCFLAIVLWAMFRAPSNTRLSPPGAQPQVQGANTMDLDPWDAKRGDVVSISGAAEDFSDIDLPVDRRSAYGSNVRRWVDLSGEFRGQRIYLEVYRHPKPDLIGLLDARKLGLADIGTTEELLAEIDTRQDPSDSIEFDGKKWRWESSREIRYFENEIGDGEGLYRWLFREPDGNRLLCVEKWEGEPFEVHIARRLNQPDVTAYRASGGSV